MRHVKLYEEFVSFLNEKAKITDFKPSVTMTQWAIGGGSDATNANDIIKFATAVAQKWDEIPDTEREELLDKFYDLKGRFKKEVQKIRAAAAGDDNDPKVYQMIKIVNAVKDAKDQAEQMYQQRVEPLYSGKKKRKLNKKTVAKLEKELEDKNKQLEDAEAEFKEARKKFDNKEIPWSEVQPLAQKIEELENAINKIEGKLDKYLDA
jgi:hypothetical protein